MVLSYFCILSFIYSLNLLSPKLLLLLLPSVQETLLHKKRERDLEESQIIYTPKQLVKNCKLLIVNLLWYLFSFIMYAFCIQIISTSIFAHVQKVWTVTGNSWHLTVGCHVSNAIILNHFDRKKCFSFEIGINFKT